MCINARADVCFAIAAYAAMTLVMHFLWGALPLCRKTWKKEEKYQLSAPSSRSFVMLSSGFCLCHIATVSASFLYLYSLSACFLFLSFFNPSIHHPCVFIDLPGPSFRSDSQSDLQIDRKPKHQMCAKCTCLLLITPNGSRSAYAFIGAYKLVFVKAGGDTRDLLCSM